MIPIPLNVPTAIFYGIILFTCLVAFFPLIKSEDRKIDDISRSTIKFFTFVLALPAVLIAIAISYPRLIKSDVSVVEYTDPIILYPSLVITLVWLVLLFWVYTHEKIENLYSDKTFFVTKRSVSVATEASDKRVADTYIQSSTIEKNDGPEPTSSTADELTKLSALLDKGLITRDEFDKMKSKLI